MQAWHCVALILLSIGIFLYATFVQDFQKDTEVGLAKITQSVKENSSLLENSNPTDLNRSTLEKPAWAEFSLILDLTKPLSYGLQYHQLALRSDRFLEKVLASLNEQPLAKSEIFNPFVSELINQPHKEIISYLISVQKSSPNSLLITCKGFSLKTAKLLAELILREYPKALAFEQPEQPILPVLQQINEDIASKEEEALELKVIVEEKLGESPTDSIETMVLRAQISELDSEIQAAKDALLKINHIHKKNLPADEFLKIKKIRDFGKTEELHMLLNKLKEMKTEPSLSPLVRTEVEKNILATSQSLEDEVVAGIASLKQRVTDLLDEKKSAQGQVSDLISAHRTGLSESPALAKLKILKEELSALNDSFKNESLTWATCKKSYSLRKAQ